MMVLAAVLEMTKDHTYKVTLKAAAPAAKALQMYVGVFTPTYSAYLFIGKRHAIVRMACHCAHGVRTIVVLGTWVAFWLTSGCPVRFTISHCKVKGSL